VTRRSEWFVTKSPAVTLGGRQINYLISFAMPRFCDQSLDRSRKERFYPGADPWIAKLDTVVHELYHIDPEQRGIRRIEREDGTYSAHCHGHRFFEEVAAMVNEYLESRPRLETLDFLRHDFGGLESNFGGVVGTAFRSFPSYPQRYIERAVEQPPCDADAAGVQVEPLPPAHALTRYSDDDVHVRQFMRDTSRRLLRKGAFRAA